MKIKEIFKKNNNMRVESIKQMGNVDNTNDTYSKAYRTDEIKKNLKEKNFNVSDLGAYTFKTTMFKNFLRTPHYEIQKSLEKEYVLLILVFLIWILKLCLILEQLQTC